MNEQMVESLIQRNIESISDCDLGKCDKDSQKMARLAAFAVDEMNAEGVVADSSIVSIVAGMTRENKQIVKDTVLYSTLAADKLHSQGGVEWYKEFVNRLKICGWTPQSTGLSDYRVGNTRFTMEQEALKILQSAILAAALPGPAALLMLRVAKDTVEALQSKSEPLRLFENSSKTHNGAKFAIGSSAESSDGEVVMAMGALNFNTALDVTNVLFWEWSSSSVQIKRAENVLTLNHRLYNGVKAALEAKLDEHARQSILDFEI